MVQEQEQEPVGTNSIDREEPADRTADPDDELRGRRPGDDPFLPEEGFFWWLPRTVAMVLIAAALILVIAATIHHGKYRLALYEEGDTAVLERGRFRPWGWAPFIPDGALESWAPVAWPESVDSPLEGEVRVLADAFLGFIRSQAAASKDDEDTLGQLEAQEAALETWYRGRWKDEDPPQDRSIATLRAAWREETRLAQEDEERLLEEAEDRRRQREAEEAEAAAVALAEAEAEAAAVAEEAEADPVTSAPPPLSEVELARARVYQSDRRSVLREAEELLARLPAPGRGRPTDERDRLALQAFILSMDTPVVLRRAPQATPAPTTTPEPVATPTAAPTPAAAPAEPTPSE